MDPYIIGSQRVRIKRSPRCFISHSTSMRQNSPALNELSVIFLHLTSIYETKEKSLWNGYEEESDLLYQWKSLNYRIFSPINTGIYGIKLVIAIAN